MSEDGNGANRCHACGRANGGGRFCVQCGSPSDTSAGRRFAAAPNERSSIPALTSTLFPYLGRAEHVVLRVLLGVGSAVLVGLAAAGLYPVALIVAAILVPLLVVLAIREIDIYEEEPARVLIPTMVLGAAGGIGLGLLANAVLGSGSALVAQTDGSAQRWNGIILPLIGFAVALAGPLVLLVLPRFNDVLDGVTFGSASAVALVGAELLTHSTTFLAAGARPIGLVGPWIARLLTLGLAVPVLWAASVGAAAAAAWLRWRSPVADRGRLGLLGNPFVALPTGAAAVVGGALLQLHLGRWQALVALVVLDVVALLWLRVVIHVGLRQEATEAAVIPESDCPNCKARAPRAEFCGGCGIATRSQHAIGRPARWALIRFGAAFAGIAAIGAAIIVAVAPGAARPPCVPGEACAVPGTTPGSGTPNSGTEVTMKSWRSTAGVGLTYDARDWTVAEQGPDSLELAFGDTLRLRITATRTSASGSDLLDAERGVLRDRFPDLTTDPDHPLAGAAIGPVRAEGEMLAGHSAVDGTPIEALVEAASEGGVGVVVSLWTTQQAHSSETGASTAFDVFVNADRVLGTVEWSAR